MHGITTPNELALGQTALQAGTEGRPRRRPMSAFHRSATKRRTGGHRREPRGGHRRDLLAESMRRAAGEACPGSPRSSGPRRGPDGARHPPLPTGVSRLRKRWSCWRERRRCRCRSSAAGRSPRSLRYSAQGDRGRPPDRPRAPSQGRRGGTGDETHRLSVSATRTGMRRRKAACAPDVCRPRFVYPKRATAPNQKGAAPFMFPAGL